MRLPRFSLHHRLWSAGRGLGRRLERFVREHWPGELVRFCTFLVALAALAVAALASTPRSRLDGLKALHWGPLANTPTSIAVLTLLAIATILAFRSWRLRRLALRPGPIVVHDLIDQCVEKPPVGPLTTLFRRRLAQVGLHRPGPMPADTDPTTALELIRSAGRERTPIAVLAGLLEAAFPRSAYAVHGALVTRERAPRYGCVIQVVTLPIGASAPRPEWGATWEAAVESAAYAASALVIPRTRQAKRAPWLGWRRRAMPAEFVKHYVRAERRSSDRRYDEGLAGYYRALEHDAANLDLRLEIGQLQEKLGLWLDALETYSSIIEVAEARRGTGSLRERRARRRTDFLARYRRAILLGFGEPLSAQWCRTNTPSAGRTERDTERDALRRRLTNTLASWKDDFGAATPALEGEDLEFLRTAVGKEVDSPEELWVRRFFQVASWYESERLTTRFRPGDTGLAPASLRVANLWSQLRLAATIQAGTCRVDDNWGSTRGDAYVDSELLHKPAALEKEVRKRLFGRASLGRYGVRTPWQPLTRVSKWSTRYNAACTYAVALAANAGNANTGKAQAKLAELAVGELRAAFACTGPDGIASRRDWVLNGDPDLDHLRPTAQFLEFEATFMPSDSIPPERPTAKRRYIEMRRYTARLLAQTAHRMEQCWHSRSHRMYASVDAHTALDWWTMELEAWERVKETSADYRHWQTRAELIDAVARWFPSDPLRVRHPTYGDKPLDVKGEDVDEAVANALLRAQERVDQAPAYIDGIVKRGETTRGHLSDSDERGRPIEKTAAQDLCARQAAAWGRLREWMEAPLDDPEVGAEAEKNFETAAKDAGLPPGWPEGGAS